MPAARASSTGALKAFLSTTARAIPSALAEIAVLVALTISATIESLDPVHWNSQLSRAQASWAPYWVGVKNGLVVTWQMNTNFHFGVEGKSPAAVADAESPLFLSSLLVQAASSAEAASDALVSPTPPSSRRRVTLLRPRVSTASSTTGSSLDMATLLGTGGARSVGGEPVDRGGVVALAGAQHGRREVGVVGRVGEVLGLQGEAVALAVGAAAGPDHGAVEEVARVELDAGLIGQDLQHPTTARVLQPGRQLQPGAAPVQHPVVVVAAAELQLLEAVVTDPLTDPGRAGEVHRRPGDRVDGPGGDEGRVDGREVAGPQEQLVVVDVARALTGQVPVGVVGQVDDRGGVGGRLVAHAQGVAVVEGVGDGGVQGARVVLLAVGADPVEPDPHEPAALDHAGLPDPLVEADVAAVQMVGRVVDGQLVVDPVEGEAALVDAVGVAAGDAAEVGVARAEVALQGREPEGDVGPPALAVGHPQRLDGPAVGDQLHLHTAGVGEGVAVDDGAVRHGAEPLDPDPEMAARAVGVGGAYAQEPDGRGGEQHGGPDPGQPARGPTSCGGAVHGPSFPPPLRGRPPARWSPPRHCVGPRRAPAARAGRRRTTAPGRGRRRSPPAGRVPRG